MFSVWFWRITRYRRCLCLQVWKWHMPSSHPSRCSADEASHTVNLVSVVRWTEDVIHLFCLYIEHSVPSNSEDEPEPDDPFAWYKGNESSECWDISKFQDHWIQLVCRLGPVFSRVLWARVKIRRCSLLVPLNAALLWVTHRNPGPKIATSCGWEGSYSVSKLEAQRLNIYLFRLLYSSLMKWNILLESSFLESSFPS